MLSRRNLLQCGGAAVVANVLGVGDAFLNQQFRIAGASGQPVQAGTVQAATLEVADAARVFNVGQGPGMYPSVQAAIDVLNATIPATFDNRAAIMVWPGKYFTSAPVVVPQWTGVKGISKGLTQFQNDTTDMFVCSGNNWFEDFLIEGSANPAIWAFQGNNANSIHIRNVDMLHNGFISQQGFLRQVGATWAILFCEHCIIDSYKLTSYTNFLHNTAAAARFCDVVYDDIFFDTFHLTSSGGSFLLRGVQDVRIRNSTVRGVAVHTTGARLEKGGVTGTPDLSIRHSYFAGGVPVFGEAGTHYNLINADAVGALTSGTRTLRNSSV
jgi:hypothetical protein